MARRKRAQVNSSKQKTDNSDLIMGQRQCPNCNTKYQTNAKFCNQCGQEQSDLQIGFWELIKDFFFNNFNFDTRLLVTLRHLLFRPGFLASEFGIGRRVAYVPPVRLYLFISFIYFLVLGLEIDQHFNASRKVGEARPTNETFVDSVLTAASDTNFINLKGINRDNGAELDLAIERGELKDYPVLEHLVSQGARLLNDPDAHKSELRRLFYRSLSIAMFVLMPLFAMLLWLFWGRPRPYYINTLIFSIHIHSFVFLVFILTNVVAVFVHSSWLDLLALLLFFIYLLVGLQYLTHFTFWKAFRRSLALLVSYSFFVGIILIVVGLLSVWFV